MRAPITNWTAAYDRIAMTIPTMAYRMVSLAAVTFLASPLETT